jgi:DHA1 family bicyclomycin/chloramphenicol resistance-like MFS transporter
MKINTDSFGFTLFLGCLGMLPPLAIDMGLPALSAIGADLHTTDSAAALTITLFMIGFAVTPVAYGPLSDRYGRRPLLIFGCALFALAGLGCSMAPSISALLFFRFFQGAGAGGSSALIMAVVRDLFEGNEARARLSYVNIVRTVAPMIAPTIGALILSSLGWRSIYCFLGVGGMTILLIVLLSFEESAKHERLPITVSSLLKNYGQVLRNPVSCGYAAVNACAAGSMFAYVSNSPLLMMKVFHVSARHFGFLFATTAMGIMLGAFINGKLSERGVPPSIPLQVGLIIAVTASATSLAITAYGVASVLTLMPFLFLGTFSIGLIAPNAAHGCLHPLPHIAGVASACLACSQMLTGAISSAIVAFFYDGRTSYAMTSTMFAFTLTSLLIYFLIVRPAERYRLLHEHSDTAAIVS